MEGKVSFKRERWERSLASAELANADIIPRIQFVQYAESDAVDGRTTPNRAYIPARIMLRFLDKEFGNWVGMCIYIFFFFSLFSPKVSSSRVSLLLGLCM